MSCGCGETIKDHSYISKQIKVNGVWYTVISENVMDGSLGVIHDNKMMWIKPSRIEAVKS